MSSCIYCSSNEFLYLPFLFWVLVFPILPLNSCIYCSIEFLYLPFFHWIIVLYLLFSHWIFVFTILPLSYCTYRSSIDFMYEPLLHWVLVFTVLPLRSFELLISWIAFLNDKIKISWIAYLKNKLQISLKEGGGGVLAQKTTTKCPATTAHWILVFTVVLLSSCIYRSSIEFLYLPLFHWVLVLYLLFFHWVLVFFCCCCYWFFLFFAFLNDTIQISWRAYLKNKLQISWRAFLNDYLAYLETIPWRRSLGDGIMAHSE